MATINGKNILASGSYLFRTRDEVRIPGNPSIVLKANEMAPYGISTTVDATGAFVISINGMVGQIDVGAQGTATVGNVDVRFDVNAMRVSTAADGTNTYRAEYSYSVA